MMDVGAAFVADVEAFVLVDPGEGALDRPAVVAETGAVRGQAARDHGLDPALPDQAAVLVVVVAAVGEQAVGSLAGPAGAAADRHDGVQQRDQLGHVVAVGAGHAPGQRCAVRVGQEVVLGARPAAVDRARARRGAPFLACT